MLKRGKGKLHQLSILIKLLNQVQPYRAGTEYRLLILDGHSSHFNWEFFDYCLNAKILPLCLPAHSTHILQPLDVGLFSPLQRHYSNGLDAFIRKGNAGMNKGEFLPLVIIFYPHTTSLASFFFFFA